MVTNIIVARVLAPEHYGEYSLVLTYISIFYFVASLGLNQLVTRSVARDQDNSEYYFRLSLILRLFGFLVAALAFGVYGYIAKVDLTVVAVFSILGGVFLESLWDGQQNVAFGMQRMEWNTIIGLASALLNLLIYVFMYSCLPRAWFTVESVLLIYIGVYVLKNIAYYICMRRYSLLRLEDCSRKITAPVCRSFLIESLPFYVMFLLALFTGQFPILFLENNAGIEEVAYFNTANKLLLPITLFMTTAFSAFFPNQSILFAKDKEAFSRQTRNVLGIVCGTGVFLALCISLFKGEIVWLLYGDAYRNTADVLSYQTWYTVMYGIFCLNGNTLGAADAQKKLAACSIIYAVVSTPILYYSSKYGADGLAIGFVVASIINLTYIMPVLKHTVGGSLTWGFSLGLLAFVFASAAVGIFVFGRIPLAWRIVLLVIMCASVFVERKRIWKELRS
ncbi:MAG: oligosaccharide flippase family protein [Bacteroidales bacterium]|nr:oligosaccharide flippase family protein [Bacteroidales bacterium]